MDRNRISQPFALPATDDADLPALEGGDDPQSRRCVCCRVVFEDAPALNIQGQRGKVWSLCPSCLASAFPGRSRSTALLTLVRPHVADQTLAAQDGSHPS